MQVEILHIKIAALRMQEAVAHIARLVENGVPSRVVTANPEIIYRSLQDHELRKLINNADLITADGEGIVWAARFLGQPVPERVTGIDLILNVVPLAAKKGWRIFLLGGVPGIAERAASRLKASYPGLESASHHGYFDDSQEAEVIARIREFKPQLLLVGLGNPRQEKWIAKNYQTLEVAVSMGVGGSFDVLSGKIQRAPAWLQKLRLEWLARLLKEPWRIKRQMALPKFIFAVFKQKISFDPQK